MERLSRLRFIDVERTREPVHKRIRPRRVPNALQDHPVVDTADLGIATDVTSQLLGHCQVSPRNSGRSGAVDWLLFDWVMAHRESADSGAVEIRSGRTADARMIVRAATASAPVRSTFDPGLLDVPESDRDFG